MNVDDNPYASPTAELEPAQRPPGDYDEAERIRREFFRHEDSIKAIGTLCVVLASLGGVIAVIGFCLTILALAIGAEERGAVWTLTTFSISFLVALLLFVLGRGLWAFDRRVRLPVGLLTVVGLIAFPLGTLISVCVLYLLFSKNGKFVFSAEYQEIIRQTPRERDRISFGLVVFLAIALTVVGVLLAVALFP